MINKFVTMATAVMMCTAAGTYALAQDSEGNDGKRHMRGASHRMHHDGFGNPARMLDMMIRHLELDDTQTRTIGNILEAAKPEIDALRERVQATRKALYELDVSDPGYGADLQNLSTDIGALSAEAALVQGMLRADVFAELTPEQRERAAEGRSRMRDRFRHGGGRHAPETDSSESE